MQHTDKTNNVLPVNIGFIKFKYPQDECHKNVNINIDVWSLQDEA